MPNLITLNVKELEILPYECALNELPLVHWFQCFFSLICGTSLFFHLDEKDFSLHYILWFPRIWKSNSYGVGYNWGFVCLHVHHFEMEGYTYINTENVHEFKRIFNMCVYRVWSKVWMYNVTQLQKALRWNTSSLR